MLITIFAKQFKTHKHMDTHLSQYWIERLKKINEELDECAAFMDESPEFTAADINLLSSGKLYDASDVIKKRMEESIEEAHDNGSEYDY